MDIHFLTPFPEMINSILNESILSRSASKGIVKYNIYNLFDYADEPHNKIDDYILSTGFCGLKVESNILKVAFLYT